MKMIQDGYLRRGDVPKMVNSDFEFGFNARGAVDKDSFRHEHLHHHNGTIVLLCRESECNGISRAIGAVPHFSDSHGASTRIM
jgi:hypothetical protein